MKAYSLKWRLPKLRGKKAKPKEVEIVQPREEENPNPNPIGGIK